jgi:hypothetical protein
VEIKSIEYLIKNGQKAQWSDSGIDVLNLFIDYVHDNSDKKDFKFIDDVWLDRDAITELGIEPDKGLFYVICRDDIAHPTYFHKFIVNWFAGYGITKESGGKYCREDYLAIAEGREDSLCTDEKAGLFGVYYYDDYYPPKYTEFTSHSWLHPFKWLIPCEYNAIRYDENSDTFFFVKEYGNKVVHRIQHTINRFGEIINDCSKTINPKSPLIK